MISILAEGKHIYLGYPKTLHMLVFIVSTLLLTCILRFKVEKTYLFRAESGELGWKRKK